MNDERRATQRHEVDLPAHAVIEDQTHELAVQNLSLGGALIKFPERLPMGQRMKLSFSIFTHDSPIETEAIVRWSTEGTAGVQFEAGLRAREVWALNKYFDSLARAH